MTKIKRALISVSDKTGIVELVKELSNLEVEIISTGGTAKTLQDAGVKVIKIQDITGYPEMLDGRVKTLHPNIHGAILALRNNENHIYQLRGMGIEPIDMVVVNLYPFAKTVAKQGVSLEEAIENIDIGGPSMIRSAAKNFADVAVIVDPIHYPEIIRELKENDGCISLDTKQKLAIEAFKHTSEYDQMIHKYLSNIKGEESELFPKTLTLKVQKIQDLRYGENSHQRAAFYKEMEVSKPCISNATQLQGKEISFNNIYDLNVAWELAKEFELPTAVVIKHSNPCGVASAESIGEAYHRARLADPVSAFGGVVGLNRTLNKDTAEKIVSTVIDAVIAPGFEEGVMEILSKRKNMLVLKTYSISGPVSYKELDLKKVVGGLLVQEPDDILWDKEKMKVVTQKEPSSENMEDLLFAWQVVKYVKSNAIVVAKDKVSLGIGIGQVNRVDAVKFAIGKASECAKGAVLASDGFFPFRDSVEEAAKAGIVSIIQPGGSIRDEESIEAANQHNMAMIFTGIRHFRH